MPALSTPVHFFAWIEDLPEYNIALETDRKAFAELFRRHVISMDPEDRAFAEHAIGAIRTFSEELTDDRAILSAIVNCVQHRECSEQYCKRKKKGAPEEAPEGTSILFPKS